MSDVTTGSNSRRVRAALAKLDPGGATRKEIMAATGLGSDDVGRVLGSDPLIERIGSDGRYIWRLKAEVESAPARISQNPSPASVPGAGAGEDALGGGISGGAPRPLARRTAAQITGKDGAALGCIEEGPPPPPSRSGKIGMDDPIIAAMRALTGANFLRIPVEKMPITGVRKRAAIYEEETGTKLVVFPARSRDTIVRLPTEADAPQPRPGAKP